MSDSFQIVSSFYSETGAGGFTSIDGTVQFYTRVNALLDPSMKVLDFGAGRAQWFHNDSCAFRRNLRLIRGKVAQVVGCDVDTAVLSNPCLDQGVVIKEGARLPFCDAAFDMVLTDYTFEHIADPGPICAELERVVKPGGWICARTPNKYGLVSLFARLVKNKYHARLLAHVQPERRAIDVFPTAFQLNTLKAIDRHFSGGQFENYSYRWDFEPTYFFNSATVFRLMLILKHMLPNFCAANLFVFLRKRP